MSSKRDVQIVRLACKWRWLTAEQGEECLALERKLAGKHTIEEIIRRCGYLDDAALSELAAAADKAGARRRPLFGRGSAPTRPATPRPVVAPPREQTVVRALDLIQAPPPAPPTPSARPSRRPRPAAAPEPAAPIASGGAAPSARPRRRAPIAPPGRDETRVEPPAIEAPSLGAAVPELEPPEADARLVEPALPRSAPRPAPVAEVTRFEPNPWFEAPGGALEEPPLPETSRASAIPEEQTRYDPLGAAALAQPAGAPETPEPQPTASPFGFGAGVPSEQQERTVLAPLPAEFLARLRGPDPGEPEPPTGELEVPGIAPAAEAPTGELPLIVPHEQMERSRSTAAESLPGAPAPDAPERSTLLEEPRPEAPLAPGADFDIDFELDAPAQVTEEAYAEPLPPLAETPDLAAPMYPPSLGLEPERPPPRGFGLDAPAAPRPQSTRPTDARSVSVVGLPADHGMQIPPPRIEPSSPALDGVAPLQGPLEEAPSEFDSFSLLEEEGLAEELLGPFGPYELERIVARGQQSVVYAGKEVESGAKVAVKVLARDPADNQAFISARGGALIAAAAIRSPYVVRVLDVGRVDTRHYVTLEHVDGWTLADRLAFEDAPSAARAFAWAAQVAAALGAARAAGVAHSDVRPDRVLIDPTSRARLTGFGFSPLVPPEPDPDAPPEGRSESAAADAYGLGLVLRAALTGDDPSRDLPPGLPGSARALVEGLLDPDPSMRPADFGGLSQSLSEYAEALERAPEVSEPTARPVLRQVVTRAALFALGLLALTVVGAAALPLLGIEGAAIAKVILHSALAGAAGLGVATLLLATLDLIRRGEIPLPQSTQWLVQVGEGAGAFGALAVVVQLVLGPPAAMNALLAVFGIGLAFSAVFGVTLRRAVARARPDRGVGRMLAVLSDPWLVRWRTWHGPALTTLAFLATARFALLAYFASS